jgi:hypothetical protein
MRGKGILMGLALAGTLAGIALTAVLAGIGLIWAAAAKRDDSRLAISDTIPEGLVEMSSVWVNADANQPLRCGAPLEA